MAVMVCGLHERVERPLRVIRPIGTGFELKTRAHQLRSHGTEPLVVEMHINPRATALCRTETTPGRFPSMVTIPFPSTVPVISDTRDAVGGLRSREVPRAAIGPCAPPRRVHKSALPSARLCVVRKTVTPRAWRAASDIRRNALGGRWVEPPRSVSSRKDDLGRCISATGDRELLLHPAIQVRLTGPRRSQRPSWGQQFLRSVTPRRVEATARSCHRAPDCPRPLSRS